MPLRIEEGTFVSQSGLNDRESDMSARVNPTLASLEGWKIGLEFGFFSLPYVTAELEKAGTWAAAIRDRADDLAVFGIGGSSLGAEMLISALPGGGVDVTFYDNVDPDALAAIEEIDWSHTFLLVVSKSGGTAETLTQFLTTLPALEKFADWRERIAVITENPEGALGKIAEELEIPIIEHPPVGGRFSVLSVVGLLPAAAAGVDVEGVVAGARKMAEKCLSPGVSENPAFRYAASQYLMAESGRNISLMMVYADRLSKAALWYRQLWAESLGKRDKAGKAWGLTPVEARGVTDQHSQLQLYLDGPEDKQFTLLYDPTLAERGLAVDERFAGLSAVAPLAGKGSGELFDAEFKGTRDALIAKDAPVRTLNLPAGDAEALGEMILLLEAETVAAAEMMGIDPFDQPAVEDSKVRARAYLAGETG